MKYIFILEFKKDDTTKIDLLKNKSQMQNKIYFVYVILFL